MEIDFHSVSRWPFPFDIDPPKGACEFAKLRKIHILALESDRTDAFDDARLGYFRTFFFYLPRAEKAIFKYLHADYECDYSESVCRV